MSLYISTKFNINYDTEEMKLAAVNGNGYAIQHISNPSEEIKLAAVKQNGYAIEYINEPSDEVKLAAVKENGWAIQYIEDQPEEIKLAAVHQDGLAIKYISDSTEEMKLAADSTRYKSDLMLINAGKKPIEYFKKQKNKIYKLIAEKNKSALIKLVESISKKIAVIKNVPHELTTNNRRKLCETDIGTITNQCEKDKLIIDGFFYINMLCNELLYNPFKADIILDNKISKIVSINKFSEQPGTTIEKLS